MMLGVVIAIFVYLGIGAAVAVPMALRGIDRLDPAAAAGTLGFRVLATPGVMVLWPLVMTRWLREHRS